MFNKQYLFRDKIELFADGFNKDQAIILAARASRSQHEFYIEPIDAAILSLLDDPEQVSFPLIMLSFNAYVY